MRALLAVALLVAPASYAAAQAHEDFARAATDVEALRALGATLLNTTEVALTFTVDDLDAKAINRAKLADALTADLALIASLEDVESGSYLAPLVEPYTLIAQNVTTVTSGFAEVRHLATSRQVALLTSDVLGLYGDADSFDALGYDTTRLRELIALLLEEAETLPRPTGVGGSGTSGGGTSSGGASGGSSGGADLVPPFLLLELKPVRVPLGQRLAIRGIVSPPAGSPEVRLILDGTPYEALRPDAQGSFRTSYDVPLDARLGTHRVDAEARVAGQLLTANQTFEVVPIATILTFTPERATFHPDQPVVLRARLLDGQHEPISDAVAALSLDGGAPSDLTFLTDGSAVVRYEPGELARGDHRATLVYAGDALHAGAQDTAIWAIAILTPTGDPRGVNGDNGVNPPRDPTLARFDWLEWLLDLLRLELWLPWVIAILLTLAAEVGTRTYLRRHPHLFAPGPAQERRARAAVERLVPIPRALPPDDPRRIVLLAYRDVLLMLIREGVQIERMTHLEVARALEQRGRDIDAVRLVTDTFEEVRYGGETVGPSALSFYLPAVLRITRPGGS